jgi:hypothetical protein
VNRRCKACTNNDGRKIGFLAIGGTAWAQRKKSVAVLTVIVLIRFNLLKGQNLWRFSAGESEVEFAKNPFDSPEPSPGNDSVDPPLTFRELQKNYARNPNTLHVQCHLTFAFAQDWNRLAPLKFDAHHLESLAVPPSGGIPTSISRAIGLPARMAGLNFQRPKAIRAASSICVTIP